MNQNVSIKTVAFRIPESRPSTLRSLYITGITPMFHSHCNGIFRSHRFVFGLLAAIVLAANVCCGADPINLDDLLKEYQAHGLPLPTKTAKLVKYNTGWESVDKDNNGLGNKYAIGFELQPAIEGKKQILLLGTNLIGGYECQEIKPVVDSLKGLRYNEDTDLIHAIQCHSLGWDALAHFLYERSQKDVEEKPELNTIAWSYWMGQVTEPKIDRAPVAKRLNALKAIDKTLDTEFHRSLIKSLELSLVPSKAKPGSIESLVDALVDDSTRHGSFGVNRTSEQFWNLAKLGFDAVPTLIESLDDTRLTRATLQGFNNTPTRNLRVQDIAGDLINGLADRDLIRGSEHTVQKSDALKWWETAKKRAEESYLLDGVLPQKNKEELVIINEHCFAILNYKYPQRIPSLYRTVLEMRPDVQSWEFAEALAQSKQSDENKIELFLLASRHADFRHRLPGLQFLAKLDPKSFDRILIETLDSLPEDVSGKYWLDDSAHFARLAIESDDPRIWPVLEKVVHRSSLGLKMQMLERLSNREDKRHLSTRMKLLAQFLDDDTVRVRKSNEKFDGPCAGFTYRKIELRNYVATQLAAILDIPIEVDEKRMPAEWATIRERVRRKWAETMKH